MIILQMPMLVHLQSYRVILFNIINIVILNQEALYMMIQQILQTLFMIIALHLMTGYVNLLIHHLIKISQCLQMLKTSIQLGLFQVFHLQIQLVLLLKLKIHYHNNNCKNNRSKKLIQINFSIMISLHYLDQDKLICLRRKLKIMRKSKAQCIYSINNCVMKY